MKWKRHEVPIFRVETFFCITKDRSKVIEKLNRMGFFVKNEDRTDVLDPESEAACFEVADKNNNKAYVMWLQWVPKTADQHDTLAHEIRHLESYVFEHIGFKDQLPTKFDEVNAYLVGHLTGEFLKFARK